MNKGVIVPLCKMGLVRIDIRQGEVRNAIRVKEMDVIAKYNKGEEELAKIVVEGILTTTKSISALEFLKVNLATLETRIEHLTASKKIPEDMFACVATLMFFHGRVNIKELDPICEMLTKRFGKKQLDSIQQYADSRVVSRLSIVSPSQIEIENTLESILKGVGQSVKRVTTPAASALSMNAPRPQYSQASASVEPKGFFFPPLASGEPPNVGSSNVLPPVEPHNVLPPVEPHNVLPPVEPHNVLPPVEPHNVLPPVEPHNVLPPVLPLMEPPALSQTEPAQGPASVAHPISEVASVPAPRRILKKPITGSAVCAKSKSGWHGYHEYVPSAEDDLRQTTVIAAVDSKKMMVDARNRVQGCFLAGACGDALGYPVEFSKLQEIIEEYGEHGICEMRRNCGMAEISDDTQMDVYTAQGILHALYAKQEDYSDIILEIHKSYIRWLYAQSGSVHNDYYSVYGTDFLQDDLMEDTKNSPLKMSRAPGHTCTTALASGKIPTTKKPINDSMGCGTVMRVAPCAVYCIHDINKGYCLGKDASALTHGHVVGYEAGGALVVLLINILNGETIDNAVSDCIDYCERIGTNKMITNTINKAVALAKSDMDDRTAIASIGKGWVAHEALGIAIFCALRHSTDLRQAIISAVNHDGDSDSTGCICGYIIGASLGKDAIPPEWLKDLELKDLLIHQSDEMTNLCY